MGVNGTAWPFRRSDPHRRALAAATVRDLTPPPAGAFAAFGAGTVLVPPARVHRPDLISLGRDIVIHEHAWLAVGPTAEGSEPRLTIGDRTRIGRMCHIACVGAVSIGADVLTAERIFIVDTYHGYEEIGVPILDQAMAPPRPVTIERGAFIGVAAIVLGGVTIGEGACVAAGAVVTESVPAHTLVIGNPARPVRRYDAAVGDWVACG